MLDSEQRLLNAQLIVANAEYNHYAGQANLLAYLGRLQAAALTNVPAAYDPAKNLERQRRSQIGPFQLILQPLDKLQKPNGDTRAAPVLPAAPGTPQFAPATAAPPQGALATSYPVDSSGRAPIPIRIPLAFDGESDDEVAVRVKDTVVSLSAVIAGGGDRGITLASECDYQYLPGMPNGVRFNGFLRQ